VTVRLDRFTVMFSRLMLPDHAPNGRTYNAIITCVAAGDSANSRSLKTASGICGFGIAIKETTKTANIKDFHWDTSSRPCMPGWKRQK
jgi:hypothetical protein